MSNSRDSWPVLDGSGELPSSRMSLLCFIPLPGTSELWRVCHVTYVPSHYPVTSGMAFTYVLCELLVSWRSWKLNWVSGLCISKWCLDTLPRLMRAKQPLSQQYTQVCFGDVATRILGSVYHFLWFHLFVYFKLADSPSLSGYIVNSLEAVCSFPFITSAINCCRRYIRGYGTVA
jgi:hypothetical protein